MTIPITDLFTPATESQWLQTLLTNAGTLGLSTTSWQPGGMARTIFAIMARSFAAEDQIISTMAQGGFLDYAALVTPDPSTSPTALPGWLDVLADSVYNCQRIQATYASGTVNFNNFTSNAYGPFAPGTFHIANGSTGKTYSNTQTLSIAANSITANVPFAADVAGAASTSAPGTITTIVTTVIGPTVTNPGAFVGANAESNTALVARCRARLAALSPNGPKDAYRFFALSANQYLPAADQLTTPVNRALVQADSSTGHVLTTVASGAGAVPGVAGLAITNATNASPIVLTVGSTTGIINGSQVYVSGVQGNTAANGYWFAAGVTPTTLQLQSSTGNGSYVASTGVLESGDLGLVDEVIQANCVPLTVTAITQSATAHNVAIVVNVWVPAAQTANVTGAMTTALATYFANLPIGGLSDPNGAYTNVVPFDAVLGAAYAAAPYIQQVTMTMNGGTSNISLGATEVAVISPAIVVNVFSV